MSNPTTPLEKGLADVMDRGDAKIADLQRQIDAINAKIAAGGTSSGGTTSGGTTGGGTTTTWTALSVPSFGSPSSWTIEGSGATVANGVLTTSGTYKGGKAYALISGVTAGKQARITFTIDTTKTTGSVLPYISFVNQSTNPWSWPDPVDMTPTVDTSVAATRTFQCTVPAGATAVYVGGIVDTGTAVVTSITVEQA